MSKNQRLRQRAQRREKRQIKAALLAQSQYYSNSAPISRNIDLSERFKKYAIRETQRDIDEHLIEDSRIPILKTAMQLQKKLEKPVSTAL